MKIKELLSRDTLSLSFEVFPPKKDTAFENVKNATEQIAALQPAFVSVTYGAGGGTSRYTLDIAKNIKERFGVSTMAHLTCVSSTKETVHQKIEEIKAAGRKPMIYVAPWFGKLILEDLNEYPQWLALYTGKMTYRYHFDMWQYTCTSTVPGVTGDCDVNIFFPYDDLK